MYVKTKHSHRFRPGSTVTELLVAATMLVVLMGVFANMSIQSGRLWQDARHHQLALDELTNQLDLITTLPQLERRQAINSLAPSPVVASALRDAQLTAEELDDENGQRVIMSIDWHRPGPAQPISLVAWIATTSREQTND